MGRFLLHLEARSPPPSFQSNRQYFILFVQADCFHGYLLQIGRETRDHTLLTFVPI